MQLNDWVGRRLYDDEVKETNEGVTILFKAFYDKRLNEGLSVDHIGHSSKDHRKTSHCAALAHATNTERMFMGWGGFTVGYLKSKNIDVESIPDFMPGFENPYHCEINRTKYPNREALQAFAYQLLCHCNDSIGHVPRD